MRWQRIVWGMFLGLASAANPALAQQMDCGSTGVDGALNVATGQIMTLNVPNDGRFNYTTITVAGTLLFNRNDAFNPPVYLLATGDVVVAAGGQIRLDGAGGSNVAGGRGGPGGFDGGAPGIAGSDPGAGHGPGGGGAGIGALVAGNAAYGGDPASSNPTDGVVYGSALLFPLVGGSGGGGDTGVGGAGGAGAILICSPTNVVVNGNVHAEFGNCCPQTGLGSGGGVRIVAPAVGGTGIVSVTRPSIPFGHGRIRVDLIDRSQFQLQFQPAAALSVGALMAVFPPVSRELHITQVAGNPIPPGTPSPLVFTLPFNAPASQQITVRAVGFTGIVPIAIVITPDSGDRIVVNTEIDTSVPPPAEATVNVNLPQNISVRVHAWTR